MAPACPESGERRLAAAVLALAIEDLTQGHGGGCRGHSETVAICEALSWTRPKDRLRVLHRIAALRWLFGDREWPFDFPRIADALGLDADRIRTAVLLQDCRGRRSTFSSTPTRSGRSRRPSAA